MLLLYPQRLDLARFSALQRAENSSIVDGGKRVRVYRRFSALQRAENSSIEIVVLRTDASAERFSALQRAENSSMAVQGCAFDAVLVVSVLFSEPKIPQSTQANWSDAAQLRFSALQRAENSSTCSRPTPAASV